LVRHSFAPGATTLGDDGRVHPALARRAAPLAIAGGGRITLAQLAVWPSTSRITRPRRRAVCSRRAPSLGARRFGLRDRCGLRIGPLFAVGVPVRLRATPAR
jgi:hypothetical protein